MERRLAGLPEQYQRLLADTESLRLGVGRQPDGLSRPAHQRLRELAPRFAAGCRRLGEFGLPETQPWERFAPRAALLEACGLAQRVGMVCRALTWHQVLSGLDGPFRLEHADAVPGWLSEYLDSTR